MAQGKFNFLNISKTSNDERDYLVGLCGFELPSKLYSNHSGEWYASKVNGEYLVVSFERLRNEGFTRAQGAARTLRGVREIVETLHNWREDAKRSNPWV